MRTHSESRTLSILVAAVFLLTACAWHGGDGLSSYERDIYECRRDAQGGPFIVADCMKAKGYYPVWGWKHLWGQR
jgi:hypothetical protein